MIQTQGTQVIHCNFVITSEKTQLYNESQDLPTKF